MPISFERRLSQEYCYSIQQRLDLARQTFKDYSLSQVDVDNLNPKIKVDAIGFYYNALLSFTKGCLSLKENEVSWGCVELYYSLYYCLRCLLYFNKYALIRDSKKLYCLPISTGCSPIFHGNKKYTTDHYATVNYYVDFLRDSDFMLSNNVHGSSYYEWMRELREVSNYREKHFKEPTCLSEITDTIAIIQSQPFTKILSDIESDWELYCFSNDYVLISGIYKKINEAAQFYKACGQPLEDDQRDYLKKEFRKIGISGEFITRFL